MVDGEDGLPDVGAMAVLADVAGLNVSVAFAGRRGAVVAAGAIAENTRMIEDRWQPG